MQRVSSCVQEQYDYSESSLKPAFCGDDGPGDASLRRRCVQWVDSLYISGIYGGLHDPHCNCRVAKAWQAGFGCLCEASKLPLSLGFASVFHCPGNWKTSQRCTVASLSVQGCFSGLCGIELNNLKLCRSSVAVKCLVGWHFCRFRFRTE